MDSNERIKATEKSRGFPMRAYVYTKEGMHDQGKVLRDLHQLHAFTHEANAAIAQGLEVRIVDTDDYIVFHSIDGKIIFAGEHSDSDFTC